VSLLILSVVGFGWWCDVPVQNPDLLSRVTAEVDSYAQQARSLRQEQNGWYQLAPLLTEKPGPQLEPFARLAALVPGTPGETTAQLRAALADQPEAAAAVAGLPVGPINDALARQMLVWPGDHLNLLEDVLPNLGSLRTVVRALVLVGVQREGQGKPKEAMLTYLGALRLACCFSGELTLTSQIQICGMAEGPLERLAELLPSPALTKHDRGIARYTLQRLDVHRTGYSRVLDREMVVGLRALAECEAGRWNLMQASGFAWHREPMLLEKLPWFAPRYFARQQAVLANWCLVRRPALERLEVVSGSPEEFRREHPWDAGAVLFIPSYGDSAKRQARVLERIQALIALTKKDGKAK